MYSLVMAAAFTVTPLQNESYASPASAATFLSRHVQTGTLLLSKGDCLAVKVFTGSCYTHVAGVVMMNGKPYVYESANGTGVRKRTLKAYLKSEAPDVIYVLNPKTKWTRKQRLMFRQHLASEIGRPYGIKHHFSGKRAEGVHCSEYLTEALMACDLIHAHRPSRVSPASLAQGVITSNLYSATLSIRVNDNTPKPVGRNRCEQWWINTKVCTGRFCRKCLRIFACR
ncbi:MAG: hypothetical protein Tsb009_34520 [Planctomycetaceae bacterium]